MLVDVIVISGTRPSAPMQMFLFKGIVVHVAVLDGVCAYLLNIKMK